MFNPPWGNVSITESGTSSPNEATTAMSKIGDCLLCCTAQQRSNVETLAFEI
jgi:hypothetical protein